MKKGIKDYVVIGILVALFVYLVFNLNALEPTIYKVFDIHLGNIGTYSIPVLTGQFLKVALLGCLFSLLVGFAIGILCFTEIGKEFRPIVEKLALFVRAFPELAMLRFVIPILGLGPWPTIVALTAHGILPIIFSVLSGVDNIDPNIIKVAKGMGMSKAQIMFKIQLPMAIPVIVSGLRVALISCIGGATIAKSTGAGGLGVLLGAGQDTYNVVFIMECAVLICLISLIADTSLKKVEKHFMHI